jgi:hypothetical protein
VLLVFTAETQNRLWRCGSLLKKFSLRKSRWQSRTMSITWLSFESRQ